MTIAVYPGSFDPVTKGHLDILERAARVNDHVIVAVIQNIGKNPLFTAEERVELLKGCTAHIPNCEVMSFNGLTVDFAKAHGAKVMIRGLRAVSDFEGELQLAHINRILNDEIDTEYFLTSMELSYLSSTSVKELAHYGCELSQFVPKNVEEAMKKKYADKYPMEQ